MSDNQKNPSEDYQKLNVQAGLIAHNVVDENGNPTGGGVNFRIGERNPIRIQWQDGPRTPDAEGNLAPSNGAFVEDVIWAAIQRLEFFQDSKYASDYNAEAMDHLNHALLALDKRRKDRSDRGVEGKHEV